jgi:hypothetical protein
MTTLTKPSAPILTSQNATQQITLIKTAKENTSSETKLYRPLSPKDLVPRLGTSEDMIRIFLRKNYPEVHVKNKAWSISPELAKQIEKDYKIR